MSGDSRIDASRIQPGMQPTGTTPITHDNPTHSPSSALNTQLGDPGPMATPTAPSMPPAPTTVNDLTGNLRSEIAQTMNGFSSTLTDVAQEMNQQSMALTMQKADQIKKQAKLEMVSSIVSGSISIASGSLQFATLYSSAKGKSTAESAPSEREGGTIQVDDKISNAKKEVQSDVIEIKADGKPQKQKVDNSTAQNDESAGVQGGERAKKASNEDNAELAAQEQAQGNAHKASAKSQALSSVFSGLSGLVDGIFKQPIAKIQADLEILGESEQQASKTSDLARTMLQQIDQAGQSAISTLTSAQQNMNNARANIRV